MAGTGDGHVLLPGRAGNPLGQHLGPPCSPRIAVGERGEQRQPRGAQGGQTAPVDPSALAARCRPHQQREAAGAGGEGVVGKRRVVGGQDGLGYFGGGRPLHEQAGAERCHVLGQALIVEQHLFHRDRAVAIVVHGPGQPAGQRGLGGVQRRVGRHHAPGQHRPGRPGPEADGPAPVLEHQRRPFEPERLGETCHPLDMGSDGVGCRRRRLVGAAEPDQVGGHGPQAPLDQPGDHTAVEVGPCGLAVQQQHGLRGVRRPLVHVVHAQAVRQRGVAGLEGIPGQVAEAGIGRAQHLHGAQCASRRRVCWTRCP